MKTKRLAVEFLVPTVLLVLVMAPLVVVGDLLGLSGEMQTAAVIAIGGVFICIEESLTARLSKRFGWPRPRQIGKRHHA